MIRKISAGLAVVALLAGCSGPAIVAVPVTTTETTTVTQAVVESHAPESVTSEVPMYLTVTPERGVTIADATSVCDSVTAITPDNMMLDVAVREDVTFIDLQLPRETIDSGLVGLIAGDQFIDVPSYVRESAVATVVLGNQFKNRQHVQACWGA